MPVLWSAAASAVALLLLGACRGEAPLALTYDLILDAQGVVFAGSDATYARFPFGSPRTEIEQAAEVVYGEGVALRSASQGCGAGPMVFTSYGPIQLAFQQGEMVGWTMRRGAVAATEDSIAPGMTRAALERVTTVHMESDPNQPGKFAYRTPAGPIRGMLTGNGSQARVEALFAGTVCEAE